MGVIWAEFDGATNQVRKLLLFDNLDASKFDVEILGEKNEELNF